MKNLLESTLEKVGRVLSDEYGIRVVCRGNDCCTDGKTIFLPSLPDDIPDFLLDAIRGQIDHEVGHIVAKSDFAVADEFTKRHGREAFGVLNMLEDLRIEAFMTKKYPGSAENLRNAYIHAAAMTEVHHKIGIEPPILKQVAFAIHGRANGLPDESFVTPEVYAAVEAIDREIREAVKAPDTRAVAILAEQAWTVIEPLVRAASPAEQGDAPAPDTSSHPSSGGGNDTTGNAGGDTASGSGASPKSRRRRKNAHSEDSDNPPAAGSPQNGPARNTMRDRYRNLDAMNAGSTVDNIVGPICFLGLLAFATSWLVTFYHGWRRLAPLRIQNPAIPGPIKAVGFLMIPLFGIAWIFLCLAKAGGYFPSMELRQHPQDAKPQSPILHHAAMAWGGAAILYFLAFLFSEVAGFMLMILSLISAMVYLWAFADAANRITLEK